MSKTNLVSIRVLQINKELVLPRSRFRVEVVPKLLLQLVLLVGRTNWGSV